MSSTPRVPSHKATRLQSDEYAALCQLVARHSGLQLSSGKAHEVERKIAAHWPPRQSGTELIAELSHSPARLQEIVENLTVGESYFFRNRPHFDALRSRVIPSLVQDAHQRRSLSMWSAGCATGEEPYSLAMLLHQDFPLLRRWSLTIRGSDLNRRFLATAREGTYSSWSLRGTTPRLVDRYFSPTFDDAYQLHPEIQKQVTFTEHNLMCETALPDVPSGGFDLILCRNVLIYFDRSDSDRIIGRLIAALRPGGFLFVGHADALPALGVLEAEYKHGTFYYRKPCTPAARPVTATQLRPGLAVEAVLPATKPQSSPAPPAATATHDPLSDQTPDPGNPADELESARALANTGQVAKALVRLQRLAAGPGRLDHRVHLLHALVADQAGLRAEPHQSLRQALFLKRDLVVAHYFLGVLTERSHHWAAAERSYRNALRLLAARPPDEELPETGGLIVKRLQEIVEQRLAHIRVERETK